MNNQITLLILATALLFGSGVNANASNDNVSANKAEEAEMQAQLEAEYEKAMSAAENEQAAAEALIEKAREQLHQATDQQKRSIEESTRVREVQQAEMEKMRQELNRARGQLQETSRQISRVNRELSRARSDRHSASFSYSITDRPVIGVILGGTDDVGVKVLGVSPDGPSERAGIKPGDVIVSVGGQVLAAIEESANTKDALRIAMRDIKAEEPLNISVERGQQILDLTVVPELRKPLTWQSVARFPTAPSAPNSPDSPESPEHVITIERIEVPEIDTEKMTTQIARMRAEIDERRAMGEAMGDAPMDGEWELEFHDLSELGSFALDDANIWFGLPMTQGLQLAEIDPGLGEYFNTDRGVLVLKARQDNDLNLQPGDVILQVGETEVNSPAEFMRALRGFHSGDELVVDIKRKRKDHTLKTLMPESRTSLFAPGDSEIHTFTISTTTD